MNAETPHFPNARPAGMDRPVPDTRAHGPSP